MCFEKAVKAKPNAHDTGTLFYMRIITMNNLPLQPLVWTDALTTTTIFRTYKVRLDVKGRFSVYYESSTGKPATGFISVDDAKHWAEFTHYASEMQPYVKPDSIGAYFDNFTQWANDRQIIQNGDILAQGLKLVSEIGELADNLAKDRCIKDDIGDCIVVLNNLAQMTDTPLVDCLAQAWNDIKDRKGAMNEHGVFIKDGDVG